MSGVIERIQKRAFYPVKLVNGETVHLRPLKFPELRVVQSFRDDDDSIGYTIGCALLNDDGSTVFTIEQGETSKQFGARVIAATDLPLDIHHQLIDEIFKLSNNPSERASEAIVKN